MSTCDDDCIHRGRWIGNTSGVWINLPHLFSHFVIVFCKVIFLTAVVHICEMALGGWMYVFQHLTTFDAHLVSSFVLL